MSKSTKLDPLSSVSEVVCNRKRLPADHVQYTLYKSNGYWYHAAFCCDYADPHWGVIVSSTQLPAEECANSAALNTTTKSHPINYQNDKLTKHRDNKWSIAAGPSSDALTPDSGITDFELEAESDFYLVKQFDDLVTFRGPSIKDLKDLRFRLRIFQHREMLQPNAAKEPYHFAVADGCESATSSTRVQLDDVEFSAVSGNRLAVGMARYRGSDFPVLIVITV
jgi:hypothetical protein